MIIYKLIVRLNIFFKINNMIKDIIAAIIGSVTHPIEILPAIDHCTSLPPFNKPIPITAPTTACELDTGTRGIEGKFIE